MIGVALGNDTAGGAQGDGSLAQILDGGVGSNTVEGGHGILGGEGHISQLLDHHIHSTLCAALFLEEVDADAGVHITVFHGSTQLLALQHLHSQLGHDGGSLTHAGSAVGGGNDQDLVLQVCAGILFVHTGQNGDAQFLLDCNADVGASIAVTAGVESRTCNEQIGLLLLDPCQDLSLGFLLVLSKVGVTTNDGGNDLCLALPGLIQGHTGADEAFTQLGSNVSHFFAADVGKELVDIVYNTITH